MNGRTTVPIKSWQAEYEKLTADKFSLCEDYYRLKDETRYVELLRKSTENLMRDDVPEISPARINRIQL